VTIRRDDNGSIVLDGNCPVEDAEPLLQLLQSTLEPRCDWTGCGKLHSAVVQVILAARPALAGPCGDPWVQQWVAPHLANKAN
jgi:hypothetical protein